MRHKYLLKTSFVHSFSIAVLAKQKHIKAGRSRALIGLPELRIKTNALRLIVK